MSQNEHAKKKRISVLRFGSSLTSKMPYIESMRKKKERLYDHVNMAIEKPDEFPLLCSMLMYNARGRHVCRSRNDDELNDIRERIEILEYAVQELHFQNQKIE